MFSPLPGDALELEGEKQKKAHCCIGNGKRQRVLKPSMLEVPWQGQKQVREYPQEQTYFPWMFKLQDRPYKLLFYLRDPKAQNRHSAALFQDVRRKRWDYFCIKWMRLLVAMTGNPQTGLESALLKSLGLELEWKFPRVFRACTQSGKAVPAGS